MTKVYVTRGASSNPNRSTLPGSSSSSSSVNTHVASNVKEEEHGEEVQESVLVDELLDCSISGENKASKCDISLSSLTEGSTEEVVDIVEGGLRSIDENMECGLRNMELTGNEVEESSGDSMQMGTCSSCPPPPPVPPPKPSSISNLNPKRNVSGSSNGVRIGQSRRAAAWPVVLTRTSPSGSRPSSPRSHGESEGYNSADEQNAFFGSSYDDLERERQFDIDIRHAKGFEVKRMVADGNCLFRAVADQVYGDSELYDLARQMCIDYMEHERDHFSQFITEGFTSYCKRKRRDKVYGNNAEIQALSEMYNRPIHIYSYSTEPINIFHGTYNTDTPPIRLSYHHGNHYNSLVDPRRLSIGAGLGFSSLSGTNIDKDKVKAAIKSQQDQQIDNALLAEGRFYSDLELTEKEIERMVMEASRAEYLGGDKFKQQLSRRESSTSGAEPSSSGARPSGSSMTKAEGDREQHCVLQEAGLSSSMQVVLSMGFTYLQAIEAYSIFGDDVDSMIDYLVETDSSSRRKGKATE